MKKLLAWNRGTWREKRGYHEGGIYQTNVQVSARSMGILFVTVYTQRHRLREE